MQLSSDITVGPSLASVTVSETPDANVAKYAAYKIIRRNGAVVNFEPTKISIAMTKAFLAVNGGQGAASARVREQVAKLTDAVVNTLIRRQPSGGTFHIEDIQDQVELALMRGGEHEVARSYVLYREKRAQERAHVKAAQDAALGDSVINVIDNGVTRPLDMIALKALIEESCIGLLDHVKPEFILEQTVRDLYDGVPQDEVFKSAILASRALIEKDPAYTKVTARLLLHTIRKEVLGEEVVQATMSERYAEYFPDFIKKGVKAELLDERLAQFDLRKLGDAIQSTRDYQFDYLGLQTLYDRYFLHVEDRRIELPQAFYACRHGIGDQ